MKPLSIMAAIFGVICIVALYAGNANAVANGEWKGVVKCMTDCKKADCKDLTGQDRAVCNHTCWCQCFPEGCQTEGDVCLDEALANAPGSEVAGGVATPTDHFMATLYIDENQNYKSGLKVIGDYRGMTGTMGTVRIYECLFDIFALPIDALVWRVDPDSAEGCPSMSDEADIPEFLYLSGETLYDPEEDSDVLYVDTIPGVSLSAEEQFVDCVEILTGLQLILNGNECPAVKDCGCEYVLGDITQCFGLAQPPDFPCPGTCIDLYSVCNYVSGPGGGIFCRYSPTDILPPNYPDWPEGYGECEDPWSNPDCCYMRIFVDQPVACLDSNGVELELPCDVCDFSGVYDDDFDYGLDTCDFPNGYYDDLDFDGVAETLTIDYANCPFEMARIQLDNDGKEWVSTLSAQLAVMQASQARDLITKGKVVKDIAPDYPAWLLDETIDCLMGKGIDEAQEE